MGLQLISCLASWRFVLFDAFIGRFLVNEVEERPMDQADLADPRPGSVQEILLPRARAWLSDKCRKPG